MRKKRTVPSAVQIFFTPTPDGLVLDRIVLQPANGDAERDLRRFLDRFRDPELDLNGLAIRNWGPHE